MTTTSSPLCYWHQSSDDYSPVSQDLLHPFAGPSGADWLGTDEFGRDIWSRLLYAGRTDSRSACLAVSSQLSFGVFIGTVCGYCRRWHDTVVMRVVDIVLAFPFYV